MALACGQMYRLIAQVVLGTEGSASLDQPADNLLVALCCGQMQSRFARSVFGIDRNTRVVFHEELLPQRRAHWLRRVAVVCGRLCP